jgi:S1-C subfamily serine protease
MWTTLLTLVFWVFLLSMHASLGWRSRNRMTPRTAFKVAWRMFILMALFYVTLVLMVPNYNWVMGLALVVSPWVGALVTVLPPRKKRMGQPLSETLRFAQEAIAVVQIGPALGNGFWVAPNRLITNFHLLAAGIGGRMWAHMIGSLVELKVVAIDPISDLVALEPKGSGRAVTYLKLAKRTADLKEGDALVHACYSKPTLRQPEWHEAEGTFRSWGEVVHFAPAPTRDGIIAFVGISQKAIAANLTTEAGQSGSPVLNGRHEVIAVVVASDRGEETLVMPVEAIHELLRSK